MKSWSWSSLVESLRQITAYADTQIHVSAVFLTTKPEERFMSIWGAWRRVCSLRQHNRLLKTCPEPSAAQNMATVGPDELTESVLLLFAWLSLRRKQLNFTISLKGEAGSVFSFGLWESLALGRPAQLLLQHLVVAELLLLVLVSIFATSSLRESPDDRISSRPLKWKQRQL